MNKPTNQTVQDKTKTLKLQQTQGAPDRLKSPQYGRVNTPAPNTSTNQQPGQTSQEKPKNAPIPPAKPHAPKANPA